MWAEIWNIMIWLGVLGMFVVILFLMLKLLNIFFTWKESIENMRTSQLTLVVLKHIPIFIISIPIINNLVDIFYQAQDIEGYLITTDIFYSLVVKQSIMMALFIVGWTIVYIVALIAFREYGGASS